MEIERTLSKYITNSNSDLRSMFIMLFLKSFCHIFQYKVTFENVYEKRKRMHEVHMNREWK